MQSEYDSISKEKSKTATELTYAEVISYNRKNLERELQNEVSDDTKQTQEVKAKRTAKNSVFLDLFQDKKNLFKLLKHCTQRTYWIL